MPVRKYRSVEDVPSNVIMEDGGPAAALRMAFSLSALALRLAATGHRPVCTSPVRWRKPRLCVCNGNLARNPLEQLHRVRS